MAVIYSLCTVLLALFVLGKCAIIEHELVAPAVTKSDQKHDHHKKPTVNGLRQFVADVMDASIAFNHDRHLIEPAKVQAATRKYLSKLQAATTTVTAYDSFASLMLKINVGTPAQTFYVAPNFFNADLWIVDSRCITEACVGTDRKHNQFQLRKSKTYKQYEGDEQVEQWQYIGRISSDILSLSKSVSVNQSFALAYKIDRQFASFIPDGEMGLLVSNPEISNGTPPPVANIGSVLNENIYTLFVNLKAKLKKHADTPVGQLTFGALDSEHCEKSWSFIGTSATMPGSNLFRITGFRINDIDNHRQKYSLIVPFLPFTLAPESSVEIIAPEYGAVYSESDYVYTIPCNANKNGKLPDLNLKINGVELSIRASQLILDPTKFQLSLPKGQCLFGLIPFPLFFSPVPSWYIGGGQLLDHYCIAYDFGQNRIGFAPTKSKNQN